MGILSYYLLKHTQVTHSAGHVSINTLGMILKTGAVGIQRNVHFWLRRHQGREWRRKRWTRNHTANVQRQKKAWYWRAITWESVLK